MSQRKTDWARRVFALYGCALAAACSSEPRSRAAGELSAQVAEPASPEQTPPAEAPPPPARDDLDAMLAYQGKRYAANMVADDPPTFGELEQGQSTDLLAVLKGGYCHRVIGVGDSRVEDMDLFLFDPNGVQTHQDPAEDPFPVLGTQSDICTSQPGSYRIQVHMYKGGGRFGVRVFRSTQ